MPDTPAPFSATARRVDPMDLSPAGEVTEMFDPIAFLDERVRQGGRPVEPIDSGRYIEIQGPRQTLRIPLDEEIIHIGRGIGSDLHLDDSSVSRRHAVLVPRPDGQRILDDRSSNGTFVNGQRVEQADLCDGDVITLGRVALRYVDVAIGITSRAQPGLRSDDDLDSVIPPGQS